MAWTDDPFADLIPQAGGNDPFADLTPTATAPIKTALGQRVPRVSAGAAFQQSIQRPPEPAPWVDTGHGDPLRANAVAAELRNPGRGQFERDLGAITQPAASVIENAPIGLTYPARGLALAAKMFMGGANPMHPETLIPAFAKAGQEVEGSTLGRGASRLDQAASEFTARHFPAPENKAQAAARMVGGFLDPALLGAGVVRRIGKAASAARGAADLTETMGKIEQSLHDLKAHERMQVAQQAAARRTDPALRAATSRDYLARARETPREGPVPRAEQPLIDRFRGRVEDANLREQRGDRLLDKPAYIEQPPIPEVPVNRRLGPGPEPAREPLDPKLSKKYKKLDDDALLEELARRNEQVMAAANHVDMGRIKSFSRNIDSYTGNVSGTSVPFSAGRQINNMKRFGRLYDEIHNVLRSRGVTDEAIQARLFRQTPDPENIAGDVADEALAGGSGSARFNPADFDEAGAVHPRVIRGLAAGTAGAAVGATQGDTPSERARNALIGGAVGAGVGALAFRRGPGVPDAGQVARGRPAAPLLDVTLDRSVTQTGGKVAQPGSLVEGGKANAYERGYSRGTTVGEPKLPPAEPVLNKTSLALDPTGKSFVDEQLRLANEGKYRRKVSDAEVRDWANYVNTEKLLRSERIGLTSPELQALGDVAHSAQGRAVELAAKLQDTSLGADVRKGLDGDYRAAMVTLDQALSRVTAAGSETGRALRTLRFLAKNVAEPGFWRLQLRRTLKLPDGISLPQEVSDKLDRIIQGGVDPATGKLRPAAQDELVTTLRLAQTNTLTEKVLDLRKAGLLTVPVTQSSNVLSNALFGTVVEQTVVHPLAVALDGALSLATGKRSMSLSLTTRPKAYLAGMKDGFYEGFGVKRGIEAYRAATGFGRKLKAAGTAVVKHLADNIDNENILAALDAPHVNYGNTPLGRFLQAYTGVVYGALGAADKTFNRAAMYASLRERAELRALALGKKRGAAGFEEQVQAFMHRDTAVSADVEAATFDGMFATFTEHNELASGINAFKRRLIASEKAPVRAIGSAVEAVTPFVRTPTNIIKRTLEYSPVGLLNTFDDILKIKTPAHQRALAEKLARVGVGSLLLYKGWQMAEQGLAVGSTPKDPNDRNAREQSNIQPNAIKVNGMWRNAARLGPIGMSLILGAELYYLSQKKGLAGAPIALGKVALEQPFLRGTKDLVEALGQSEQKGSALTGSFAGSFIPSAVSAVGRGMDPIASRQKEGALDYVKDRVPWWRETLTPRRSPLGDVAKNPGGVGRALFGVGAPTPERVDVVSKELRAQNTGPAAVKSAKDEPPELFGKRRTAVDSATRRALERLIPSVRYQRAKNKEELLRDAIEAARGRATRGFKARNYRAYHPLKTAP